MGRMAPERFETGCDMFTVRAARSGIDLVVPADKSIAEVLMAAGLALEVSCEQGVCGTCLTDVIEGTPDHRDMYLSDDEKRANKQMLVCCSRSQSRILVLDI
jgi:vanillate monooxygenase ferredoxin subunit